jgi:DNA-binding CsgD family transcriptional regulator
VLYGRDAERALVGALLDRARASRSGAYVIRGEPGAGKTALLDDARERATDMHVLWAQGVESESELPFAGLHQLLRPALHLVDRLPAPQAAALRGALGLADRDGDDRFLISAACLTLLAELAEDQGVLCLVDDAQWLDRSSADALLFVARRLGADGIAMLFSAREGDGPPFEARAVEDIVLGGLDADSAAALIAARAPAGIAAGVSAHLLAQSRGNALALQELPGALSSDQLSGREPLPEALPLSRDLERVFLARVHRLPEPTQQLLSLIAADDGGRLEVVLTAGATLGLHAGELEAAEAAGLVSVRRTQVEFRHPLVRSAIRAGWSAPKRREAHLALAAVLGDGDADQRAWHRAAAALGPDEEVACELERTAERARLRSGHAAVAAALRRAAELTPQAAPRARRLVAAAAAAWRAGDAQQATNLLDAAAPLIADPLVQGRADHVRGMIELRCGGSLAAHTILIEGAERVAASDQRKALEMLFDAGLAGVEAGDYGLIAAAGRQAASLTAGEDEAKAFLADLLSGVGTLVEGRSAEGVPRVIDVITRAERVEEPRWLVWAAAGAGLAGDEAAEAALLRRAAAIARASAAVEPLNMVLLTFAVNGATHGRLDAAADAEEGLQLAQEARLANPVGVHRAVLAYVAGIRGEEQRCSTLAEEAQAMARHARSALGHSIAQWGLGLLELGTGRAESAATLLTELRDAGAGRSHPLYVLASAADLVEACVRAGRDPEARAAYAVLDGFARPGAAPPWSLALAARCRGLLAGDDGEQELRNALQLHPTDARPLDRARTHLLLGEHLRRRRRRVEAREHLRAAVSACDTLGAAPWGSRARAELRASGETARRRDPSTLSQLTPQELQVARFVRQGLSNKEVAAQLFLSPRTIDAHLRSVFAKLEITSRAQLSQLDLEQGDGNGSARAQIGETADARVPGGA